MTEFESEKKNKTEFHEATQAKQIKKKNKIKSDKSLYDVFTENKSAFYGIIFYAAGLLCGAFISLHSLRRLCWGFALWDFRL